MYRNDAYAPGAKLDTDDGQGYDGKEGYTVNLAQDNGAHTFVFDMTQFSTEGRNVSTDPVDASDNLQFVFQMEAEGYYPLLVRVNGNINEEDAIATGERIITLEEAPVDSETNEVVKEPFAAVQTLYYGENKYGYSDDVKGRKGKLGPGDTYSDPELEILTLWWGQEKSESGMSLRFEDQFGITPKNQSCQILNYPFTTMPVTIHSWQLNKDTMSDWLDTLEGAGLNMVYTDSQGQQVKRENPGFRIINMLGAGDAADEDNMLRLMRETALKSTSNGEGRIDVANALVSTGIALATTYNIGTDMDMLTMKIVPTADPTEFDSYDTIQYKVYDFNTKNWSGPYTLYNGTSGAVKGMEAQMTESGAMAVAYTIEKGSTSSTTRAVTLEDGTTEITPNLQTVFALIQPDETEGYKVAKNVQVTDDKDVNENPQLTAVRFDGEEKESFILGWHSVHSADGEENNDIRLMAFTEDGTLRGDLVDSISAISSQTGSSITSNFRFAKGADTLSELSILWSQPTMEVDEESTTPENNPGTADSDVLMGVRFRVDNGTIGLTAPIQLAALEEQETTSKTIEAFDGWVQNDVSLKAVVLSTEYGVSDKEGNTYHIKLVPGVDNEGNPTGELTEVAIQNSQTNLVSVTGSYTDAIAAEVPVPDYQALAVGASVPVQTTVTNLGTQPITSIDFQVGGASQQTPVTIQPGESATVTTNYTVVETAEGTTTFQVTAGASLTETTLTVLQEYLPATVTVNGKPYDVNDIASRTFSLPVGTTTLDIVVTSGDKTHTYRVEITRLSTGGGTGGGGSTRYPITVPEEDHGTVSVSPSRASSGQTVTITVTPDEGYKVGSVTVKRPNGSTVPVTGQGNGKYTFTMPSGGVTVDVTFIPEDWPFVDVTEDKWYYDAVAYVYQQGIMVGMSETTFEPNTTVNRAQVVQMLYNLEGQPQVSGDSGFSDIRDDQWYAKAVAWASANDVVAGYEDGTFRPTRAVTREEFAQILYNYAKFKGYDLSASADLGKFPDSGQVSSWAEIALGWANGNGLINGHDDGRLDPKGSTIRAQAASILMNFDKGFAQEG